MTLSGKSNSVGKYVIFDILSLLSYDRMILLYIIYIRYSDKKLSLLLFLRTNVQFSYVNVSLVSFIFYSYE